MPSDVGATRASPAVLHEWFEEQVARTPEAIAVVDESSHLTYRELNDRANGVATALRELGVGPDVLVGVCMERSPELLVAVYGVLKAGGAYVPVDPTHPAPRVRGLLDGAGVMAVLTQRRFLSLLAGLRAPALCPDGTMAANRPSGAGADNLVYVIHTSGSTGQPKGVMNVHGAVANRLAWMQRAYGLAAADAVLHKTPVTFDVSVWELFWPLLVGARLVLARPEGHRDPTYLVRLIAEQGVTTLHFVPAMLSTFLEEPGVAASCRSVRRVICSGEALPVELEARFFSRLDAELHNLYGPTEAAIDVTAWRCRPGEGRHTVPVGRPIDNVSVDLLTPVGEPAAEGELHIGGAALARGYLGRPDLTAERFVPDALSGVAGARAYRTGDLGRRLPDGSLEFLGRLDHQVKIRGFRIELEEIQVVLAQHPAVRDSVVMARDADLVAYVVPSGRAPAAAALRAFLRERLPDYMIPAAFETLAAFPLTPSGKVDRRALAAPRLDSLVADRQRDAFAQLLRVAREPGRPG
jgi:amino acid adenylation domain-containing protein